MFEFGSLVVPDSNVSTNSTDVIHDRSGSNISEINIDYLSRFVEDFVDLHNFKELEIDVTFEIEESMVKINQIAQKIRGN